MLIYKATLPDKKSYIGQTRTKFNNRKFGHRYDSFNKNAPSHKSIFHKAIRKYGWNNVVWEILEDNIPTTIILNKREQHWIKKLKTLEPNGYNRTTGGGSSTGFKLSENSRKLMSKLKSGKNHPFYGKHRSKKTIKAISDAHIGMKPTKEIREKMSKIAKKRLKNPKNNPFYGKHHTEEFKKKQSEKLKEWYKDPTHKAVTPNLKGKEHGMWGKKHSEETRNKMKEAWKRRKEREKN